MLSAALVLAFPVAVFAAPQPELANGIFIGMMTGMGADVVAYVFLMRKLLKTNRLSKPVLIVICLTALVAALTAGFYTGLGISFCLVMFMFGGVP